MAKRKTSDSVKRMRLIIFGLSAALVVAVILVTVLTLNRQTEDGTGWNVSSTTVTTTKIAGQPDSTSTDTTQATTIATTTGVDGLPYDKRGSDVFAEWDGKYNTSDVVLKEEENGDWQAYVLDKKVKDCNGVYTNENGWWFVRDGKIDTEYNGIAGNNIGKWYISNGQVNFHYYGTFNPYDGTKHYTVQGGEVVRETN